VYFMWCQWLATGHWFSPVPSTNITDRHDIAWKIVESGVKHHNPNIYDFAMYFSSYSMAVMDVATNEVQQTITKKLVVHVYLFIYSNQLS
jgi:hypothetical protein